MTELRLDAVSKTYVRGRTLRRALAGVSLEVHSGEVLAIHGEPRSGKSTLLRVAAGIEAPDEGSVRYCGRDLASMSERELADYRRGAVALVCGSRPSLPGYRAIDYVALAALATADGRRAAQRDAHEALELAGADDCFDAELHELSEGERQRVEIAAALVRHPRVIVADEPVAGLGTVESRAVLALLRDLAERDDLAVIVTASEALELLGATRVGGLLSGGRMLIEPPPRGGGGGQVVQFPRRAASGSPDA